MRLRDRIALVTGAANGIGRGIALRFGAEGAVVLVTDVDTDGADEVAGAIVEAGGRAEALRLDVAQPDEVESVYDRVAAAYGRLDVQVSNAGSTDRMPFLETTVEFWDRLLAINLRGVFLCGQAAARLMVSQGDGGRIVNMTSISGQNGGLGRAAYGASKAGIINLTQTMAAELAEHGILVNAIAPGPTRVRSTQTEEVPGQGMLNRLMLKRYGEPGEVAAAALFLASNECSFITGAVLNVDGGFHAGGVLGET
ncbi:MAG TPA: 3-oxoacyl-ACP reductase family protein [Geminicoccaceae bacterium]|nr:3-oxoacyl-ACP reductase family protein [Geminicoccaceae bacterium]